MTIAKVSFRRLAAMSIGTAGALTLSGCGAFDTDDDGKRAEQTPVELTGNWGSPCLDADWFGFTQSQDTFVFGAGGDFDLTTVTFSDACATHQAELKVSGTSDALSAADGIDGATNINLTISKATLTPKSDASATALNAGDYCGYGDWQLGQAKDIVGRDCAGESYDDGEVVFDVYKKEGEQVFFGKSGLIFFDRSDASERPTELDRRRVFQKR